MMELTKMVLHGRSGGGGWVGVGLKCFLFVPCLLYYIPALLFSELVLRALCSITRNTAAHPAQQNNIQPTSHLDTT